MGKVGRSVKKGREGREVGGEGREVGGERK